LFNTVNTGCQYWPIGNALALRVPSETIAHHKVTSVFFSREFVPKVTDVRINYIFSKQLRYSWKLLMEQVWTYVNGFPLVLWSQKANGKRTLVDTLLIRVCESCSAGVNGFAIKLLLHLVVEIYVCSTWTQFSTFVWHSWWCNILTYLAYFPLGPRNQWHEHWKIRTSWRLEVLSWVGFVLGPRHKLQYSIMKWLFFTWLLKSIYRAHELNFQLLHDAVGGETFWHIS
jgi:hypothetical protein